MPHCMQLFTCLIACATALPSFTEPFTTPPPEGVPYRPDSAPHDLDITPPPLPYRFRPHPHRLHRAHEGVLSKADVVMAVTDKFGTIMDNFAEKISSDFDDVFKHVQLGTPFPDVPDPGFIPPEYPQYPETTPEQAPHDDLGWAADTTPHP